MQPRFSREAVVERRQPFIRWSAALAGAALALGLWNLLALVFVGGALTVVEAGEIEHLRTLCIGSCIGSVLAPLIAMFIGGLVAGRLAGFYDDRVTVGHGAIVWAVSSVAGLVILAIVTGGFVDTRAIMAHVTAAPPPPGTHVYVHDRVDAMNEQLAAAGVPIVGFEDFLDAARSAAGDGRTIDRDTFISRLDAGTPLSRPEAQLAYDRLGPAAQEVIASAREVAIERSAAIRAFEGAGTAMLGAGVGLFLCLVTAIAGAVIGARTLRPPTRRHDRPDTIPGHPTAPSQAPSIAPYAQVME